MFSDHLRKVEGSPTKALMLIAAGVVIVGQLAGMVMVAAAQVEKAQLRQTNQASASAATAWCLQSNWGDALKDCDRTTSAPTPNRAANEATPASQNQALATLVNRD